MEGGIFLLSREEFIKKSLEINLFFMRIMKEHLIFIIAGLPSINEELIEEADILRLPWFAPFHSFRTCLSLAQGYCFYEICCRVSTECLPESSYPGKKDRKKSRQGLFRLPAKWQGEDNGLSI